MSHSAQIKQLQDKKDHGQPSPGLSWTKSVTGLPEGRGARLLQARPRQDKAPPGGCLRGLIDEGWQASLGASVLRKPFHHILILVKRNTLQ